jgi:hypothetical protein
MGRVRDEWIGVDASKTAAPQPRAIERCQGCRATTWVGRTADTL